ncbi:MAG TPA: tRNA pseudouridine(38-40) synthase TruA [Anaerolineales bacterium]|nr:tRNA pseudouridine(38-40) synthase TruA [Anaerolineales bacterium]
MARYQIILIYDGTDFAGYQRQIGKRTVQGEVEAALRRLGWAGKTIQAAGRTDAGVHAAGQVIACNLDWNHAPEALQRALNANLPSDLAAKSVRLADPDFHPRYDARERRYRYRLVCDAVRDPLRNRYAWQVWPAPELPLLQQAASALLGKHDFSAFGAPVRPGGSTRRTVFAAEWQAHADELWFEIRGDAFLYHMVRRLVFALVEVGRRRMAIEAFAACLNNPPAEPPQGLAPAQGLTLMEAVYPL